MCLEEKRRRVGVRRADGEEGRTLEIMGWLKMKVVDEVGQIHGGAGISWHLFLDLV